MIYHNNNKIIKAYQNGNLVNKIDKVVSGSTPTVIKSPEYISRTSSATGYLPLGEYFTSDCVIEIDFQMTQAKGYCIIGDYMNTDADDWRLFINFDSQVNNKLNYDFLSDRKQWTTSGWGNRFHIEIGNYYVKNLDNGNAVITATSKSNFTRPNQMYLFHFDGYTGSQQNLDYGNVYFIKIKKGGVLVKDFIPWTDMNGNYGFYDKISDTVYQSVGQMTGSSTVNDVVVGNPTTSESKTIFQYVVNEVEPTPPTPIDYSKQYLTTVALTDNVTFTLTGGNRSNTFQYSTDSGETWNNIQIGQTTTAINNGEKMYWKASSPSINNELGIGTILPSASANVEGNIMSLKYGDNFSGETALSQFQFRKLFSGATHIVSAENMVLPSTTFQKQCYSQMFQGCTSLTTAPTVIGTSDATFSGDYCFSDMFNGCSGLTTAPQLPMTSLGKQCYWYMLQKCTSLTTAPLLPATSLLPQCYCGMFNGCTSLNSVTCLATTNITSSNCNEWLKDVAASGTFTKAANASWSTTGQNGIPNGWTVVDYSE